VLLNVFAVELEEALKSRQARRASEAAAGGDSCDPSSSAAAAMAVTATREDVFAAANSTIRKVTGGYAVVMLVAGVGILGFRDPNGIRPLVFGTGRPGGGPRTTALSSESVAVDALGLELVRRRMFSHHNKHVHQLNVPFSSLFELCRCVMSLQVKQFSSTSMHRQEQNSHHHHHFLSWGHTIQVEHVPHTLARAGVRLCVD
jgi:hypothetical protein